MFYLTAAEKTEVVAKCDHLAKVKFSPTHPYAFTGWRPDCQNERSDPLTPDTSPKTWNRAYYFRKLPRKLLEPLITPKE
jgi:hypothetical protein